VFTARYGLIPYIKQIAFSLSKVNFITVWNAAELWVLQSVPLLALRSQLSLTCWADRCHHQSWVPVRSLPNSLRHLLICHTGGEFLCVEGVSPIKTESHNERHRRPKFPTLLPLYKNHQLISICCILVPPPLQRLQWSSG
jgi:hypothetical protein